MATQKKICIVSISLSKGGAERSTALLSRMLDSLGYRVYLVILTDEISYDFKGEILNLGKDKLKKNNFLDRLLRFRKFKKFIIEKDFDYIIDNRPKNTPLKELLYLNYIYKDQKLIYVVRNYYLRNYFFSNQINFFAEFVRKKIFSKITYFIGVSKAITERVKEKYCITNIKTIYNPIEQLSKEVIIKERDYVLFLGRIVQESKNLNLLIQSYKLSNLPLRDCKLLILGNGPDKEQVENLVSELGISDKVIFKSYIPEVYSYLKNAKFTVLTSHYEGFPRVLIESLSVGTPVVSVNCKSGPSEIINHEKNGLLVENHSPTKLALAFDRMYEDEGLYLQCKKNACSSVEHLSMPFIAKQWKEVLSL